MHVFLISATFSFPVAGLFLALSAAGHAGARLYTTRKFGPWPGSVACALGV